MSDMNVFRKLNASISATEFEIFCLDVLRSYAEREKLEKYTLEHSVKIEAHDSTYQIDVYLKFELMDIEYITLCECKHHKDNIKRKDAVDLYGKMQSTVSNKAIIISTSGFQSDTVKYAKAHGIALWQIADTSIKRFTNSVNINTCIEQCKNEFYKLLPKHYVLVWNLEDDYPYNEIYPTDEMKCVARDKVLSLSERLD